jgi:hypothetical protein
MPLDELEARNREEEGLRRELADTVAEVEADAARRVEDGYKEASHAVHKAL